MLQPQDDPPPEHLTAAELGAIIGVSARRVRQMLHEDDPPPQDPVTRKFPPGAVGEWLRARIAAEYGREHNLEHERARLAHHQANIAAMAEADKRQNLIPADVVTAEWCNQAANVRDKLDAFPAPAAAAVAGLGSVADIERELRRLVYQTLRELAGQSDDAEPGGNA
jgi:phage terminase Nu1 subunit (DNA packaging protein)